MFSDTLWWCPIIVQLLIHNVCYVLQVNMIIPCEIVWFIIILTKVCLSYVEKVIIYVLQEIVFIPSGKGLKFQI